jgi:hypothetical protein
VLDETLPNEKSSLLDCAAAFLGKCRGENHEITA